DALYASGRMHREDPKPMTRDLIAGRSRVHRDALATVLAQSDRVRVVGTASDRAEVLARLDADRPDIVLIDVTMFDAARTVADIKARTPRSEEHTSELQSPCNLVCRLLLEKKKKK